MQSGIDFETAISTIFGIEKEFDNVELCRNRLLCNQEHLRHILVNNIIHADADLYHGRFDGTDPYKSEQDLHNETLFEVS